MAAAHCEDEDDARRRTGRTNRTCIGYDTPVEAEYERRFWKEAREARKDNGGGP
ncbi:hypothetical protein OH687_15920 [Burkholderia anthina]|nr:hypothetical protein OH687_15920 [Burkholderia anthina]